MKNYKLRISFDVTHFLAKDDAPNEVRSPSHVAIV